MTAPADASPRIVKAPEASGLGLPVAFNFSDLRRACDDHLTAVAERSRRIVGDAAAESDRIRREAADAGRREGHQAGLKAAEAEVAARVERLAAERLGQQLETVLPAVRALADELRLERDRWIARWEADAVRLAVAISEKLLRRAVAADPAVADGLIAETLRLAAGSPKLTVRLAPLDHERLGGSVAVLAAAVGQLGETEVMADPSVGPGGCVVETRHGRIDGRLETQLERIASELAGPA
jgi:flagellar assembly protein FliH